MVKHCSRVANIHTRVCVCEYVCVCMCMLELEGLGRQN